MGQPKMTEEPPPAKTCRRVRVQRTPAGKLLGCCVAIPAEIVARYAEDGSDTLAFVFESFPAGIFLRIESDGDAP